VEIPIDLRAENLTGIFEPKAKKMEEEVLKEKLKDIDLSNINCFILADISPSTTKLLTFLLDLYDKPENLQILTHKIHVKKMRKIFENNVDNVTAIESVNDIGSIEDLNIKVPIEYKVEKSMLISEVAYDPFFGFNGGPVSLLKAFNPNLKGQLFKMYFDDKLQPGQNTKASKFAAQFSDLVGDMNSIEVISCQGVISEFILKNIKDAHVEASSQLYELGNEIVNRHIKSMIVSPGNFFQSATLSSSLRSLWNVIPAMEERGTIVLMAECSEGLGSDAMHSYCLGMLNFDRYVKERKYIEGFEDLLYLKKSLEKYDLMLVSSLPNFYVKKILGLKNSKKASEALEYVIGKMGPRVKINVVISAQDTLLKKE
jgi:hypothetical protein